MCVIAVCGNRKMTEEEIENCFKCNSDGVGIGWSENGMSRYSKGFMSLDSFLSHYEEIDTIPHIVHFRNSTSGGVKQELTHPFVISKDSALSLEYEGKESVLFHNGVISRWEDDLLDFYIRKNKHIPNGHWSDTRFMAILVHHLGDTVIRFKKGGKYVILTPKGKVIMFGKFEEKDGVHFSNDSYLGKRRIFVSTYGELGGWNDHEGHRNNKVEQTTKAGTGANRETSKSPWYNKFGL